MALTRKLLKSMGIEEEKIDQIIDAHAETVDALKEERDSLKEKADKLPEVEKKLAEANKTIEDAQTDSWQVKYEAIKEEFDAFKADVETGKTKQAKSEAFKQLLKDAGVADKRIDTVMKVSQSEIDSVEIAEDGKVSNADALKEAIKGTWSDFIQTTHVQGANTAQPPQNAGGKVTKTKEEILAIRDSSERQKAIMENPEAFGLA